MYEKAICLSRYIIEHNLNAIGVADKFRAYFDHLGMATMVSLRLPLFVHLVKEFFTTFQLYLTHSSNVFTPDTVSFCLMGRV